jgi:hypothetical protein
MITGVSHRCPALVMNLKKIIQNKKTVIFIKTFIPELLILKNLNDNLQVTEEETVKEKYDLPTKRRCNNKQQ